MKLLIASEGMQRNSKNIEFVDSIAARLFSSVGGTTQSISIYLSRQLCMKTTKLVVVLYESSLLF